MPGLDSTGPQGQGPRTGNKRGRCQSANDNQPAAGNGRGLGRRKGDGRVYGTGAGRRNGRG